MKNGDRLHCGAMQVLSLGKEGTLIKKLSHLPDTPVFDEASIQYGLFGCDFSRDGEWILTTGPDVRIWDRKGNRVQVLENRGAPVIRAVFSPGGDRAIVSSFG